MLRLILALVCLLVLTACPPVNTCEEWSFGECAPGGFAQKDRQ